MGIQVLANRYCSFLWTADTRSIFGTVFDTGGVTLFEYQGGNPKAFVSGRNNTLNIVTNLTQWHQYLLFTTTTINLPDSVAGVGIEPLETALSNVFFDDFLPGTLNPAWNKLNDQPSTEPWTLGTFGGRSVLRKPTSPHHGFYKNLANGENDGGVTPVLYLTTINGQPLTLGDGFEVTTTVGFTVDEPFGQVGFVVLPVSEIQNNAANFATYVKCVYEYSFSTKIVVLLKETNNFDIRGGQDIVIPLNSSVVGAPLSLEMRFRYLGGNFVFDYREENATVWINGGTVTPNFTGAAPIAVGLYCEEDQLNPSSKSGWWDDITITNGVYVAPPPTGFTFEPSFAGLTKPTIPNGLNWVRSPETPTAWRYVANKIQLPLIDADIFQGNNDNLAPLLYYNIGTVLAEGFEAIVDLNYAATATNGQGGLLLTTVAANVFDQDNHFRVFASTGEGLLALKETNQVADFPNINVVGSWDVNNPVTLRLRYARNSSNALKLISEYRAAGTTGGWLLIGEQNYTPLVGNIVIGMYAIDFTGASPDKYIAFENFKVKV